MMIPVLAGISFSQKKDAPGAVKDPVPAAGNPVKATPAYAELLLEKTELESEIESLSIEYTDEFPKIKEARFKLAALQKEMDRMLAVKDTAKLTVALGKLLAKKLDVETELWGLRIKYNEEHPEVKRGKRKLEIFEAAVKEILG